MFESKVQKDVPQRTQAVGTALEQMDVPMKEYEDFGPGVDKICGIFKKAAGEAAAVAESFSGGYSADLLERAVLDAIKCKDAFVLSMTRNAAKYNLESKIKTKVIKALWGSVFVDPKDSEIENMISAITAHPRVEAAYAEGKKIHVIGYQLTDSVLVAIRLQFTKWLEADVEHAFKFRIRQ